MAEKQLALDMIWKNYVTVTLYPANRKGTSETVEARTIGMHCNVMVAPFFYMAPPGKLKIVPLSAICKKDLPYLLFLSLDHL